MRGGRVATMPSAALAPASARALPELVPVFLKWFALIRRRAENTVRAYEADLTAFLAFCAQAGLSDPNAVKVQHIEFYMGLLQEQRGLQPSSINRHLHALRSFWKWMQREEIVTSNPPALAFVLKQPKTLPEYLSVPDQDRLLLALAQNHSPAGVRDYALHAVGLLCGLRCSELSNLQLSHLDLERGVLRVVQGKGAKDREVPIVPLLVSILSGYLSVRPGLLHGRPSPYLFVSRQRDGRLGPKAVFYLVRKTLKRVLARERAHPHMLRHSFASRVREHGGSIQDLQEAMGHANIATTARYAHLVTTSQRVRMAKFITG
jgi:site-specific recombinase XerD